jgi:hypothetical protein
MSIPARLFLGPIKFFFRERNLNLVIEALVGDRSEHAESAAAAIADFRPLRKRAKLWLRGWIGDKLGHGIASFSLILPFTLRMERQDVA